MIVAVSKDQLDADMNQNVPVPRDSTYTLNNTMDISNGDLSRKHVAEYDYDQRNSIINIINDKAGLGYDYRLEDEIERSLSASTTAEISNDYPVNVMTDRVPRDSFEINQRRMNSKPVGDVSRVSYQSRAKIARVSRAVGGNKSFKDGNYDRNNKQRHDPDPYKNEHKLQSKSKPRRHRHKRIRRDRREISEIEHQNCRNMYVHHTKQHREIIKMIGRH